MTAEPAETGLLPGSPALTIRDAVRPAALAYVILSAEQDRAAALAGQAHRLVQDTRAFLEAAGLAHLLGDTPATATPVAGRKATLVEAYASAALHWAQIISSAGKLGAILIAERRWDDVRRLAAALKEAGETRAATDLSYSLRDAVAAEQEARLALISNSTAPDDLARALEIARDAFRAFQRYAPGALGILPRYLDSIHVAAVSWQVWGGVNPYYVPFPWADRVNPTAAEIAMRLDDLERIINQRRGWGSFT